MRTSLFASAALVSALALAAPVLAQDDESAEMGAAESSQMNAEGSTSIDLGPDDGQAGVGLAADVQADAILKGSGYEDALADAIVTDETGATIGAVESCEYGDDDALQTIVIKGTDGDLYDLPADSATFDASAGAVSTTKTFAELEMHRNALEELGDQIEDAVDGDAAPEDLGPDHHPDANDVDDPEYGSESDDADGDTK